MPEQAAGPPLTVGILGDVAAQRGTQPLDLGGPQQRRVLALLVLARGDVVPAERLVDALWGDRPPASATSSLHALISRLRSALDGGRPRQPALSREAALVRQGVGYRLALPREAIDAWRFERLLEGAAALPPTARVAQLTEALALWRGPALADHADELWAQPEAVRLDGLREVARDQLRAARLERGEHALLVPELEQLVAEEPLREEGWRLLALALYRSERQADALAALRRAREVLAEELGVDPGPALRQLEADVLAHASSLDLPAAASVPEPGPVAPVAEAPAAMLAPPAGTPSPGPPLVGRVRELADLRGTLADARAGRGCLVVLEGPAGIGKSRLLAEARRTAASSGVPVLEARGSQLEHEFGFGAVRQLLGSSVTASPGLLDGAAPAAPVFDLASSDLAPADPYLLLEALYRVTTAVAAGGPLMLAVDDLQWCDTSSLRFLGFLQRRLPTLPVVVVATVRTGEPVADEALLGALVDDPDTVRVRPAPLDLAEVGEVVRGRLGADAAVSFVAACHGSTRGNPLLLQQLLRALEGERVPPDTAHADTVRAIGSRAVSGLVLLRLRRLAEPAAEVARAVAVLGDGAELATVARLCGHPEADVVGAVAALARAEILHDDYPLGFVHPVVAEAVYDSLAPGERQAAHERAARLLDDAGASAEQVAAHLLHTPRRGDGWTVAVLERAADRAQARGAAEAAAAYVERAVDEPPSDAAQVPLLVRLGLLAGAADGPLARRALESAYRLCDDPAQRAEIALLLTGALVFVGAAGEATTFALSAVDALPEDDADDRQALLAVARIAGWIHQLPAPQWLGPAQRPLTGTGLGARMLAIEQAWELCVRGVDREEAVRLVRFGLDDEAWVLGSHDLFHDVAGIALMAAEVDTAAHWDGALERAHSRGEVLTVGVHLWRGVRLWREGLLREARQSLLVARHQTEDWGSDQVGVPYCDGYLVKVTLDLGDTAGARALLAEALPRPGIGDGRRLLREAEAEVLLAEGHPAEALALLDRMLTAQLGLENPAWFTARAHRAEALAALGRVDDAVPLLEAEVERARGWGAPSALGRLLTLLGVVKAAAGVEQLREAWDLLDGGPARLASARCALELAGRVEDRDERTGLLLRAVTLADECGAVALRVRAERGLSELGVAAPPAPPPAETLTELERAVLARVSSGADVVDVARELFVTERSAEAALASARQRLDAGNAEPLP